MRIAILISLVGLLASSSASAEDQTQVFAVQGMTCALCGKAIEKSVRAVEGVRDVRVDQKSERVTVVTSAELDGALLIEAIESAGRYTAHPVEPSDG
jgi:copper chaperone CopZ